MATKFFVSRGWADTQAREADYGAIVLAAPGYPAAGYFGLRICTDDELKNAEATILGYPLEPVRGENCDGMHQYVARGRLETILPRLLEYKISTRDGQSGSPISIFIGPKRYVVGIHTLEREMNVGVRITAEVKQDLLLWLSHS